MCFTLMNTSPQISEDRVPTISRGAEGQQRSEIAEEGTEEFVEVFNVIFELRSCPLSMHSIYTIHVRISSSDELQRKQKKWRCIC